MDVLLLFTKGKLNIPIDMGYLETKPLVDQTIGQNNIRLIQGGSSLETVITLKDEKGQSAVEFVLTFAFGLGFVFLFSTQALNTTKGFLVHYVNFMAARAYLVHDTGSDVEGTNLTFAQQKAQEVFESYPIESFGVRANFEVIRPNQGRGLYSGTVSEFEERLSTLPFVGGSGTATLYSESFLGREPFRVTCYELACEAISGERTQCKGSSEQMDIVVYDNGC